MDVQRFLSAVKGICAGLVVTGVFFSGDMMLPEPWGDYFLFAAMAVVNVVAGWLIFAYADQQKHAAAKSAAAEPRAESGAGSNP